MVADAGGLRSSAGGEIGWEDQSPARKRRVGIGLKPVWSAIRAAPDKTENQRP